jgi:hypothetical protein
MTTLQLNVGERIVGLRILDEHGRGGLALSEFGTALKIQDKLRLTEDEITKVGYELKSEKLPTGQSVQSVTWKDITYASPIELSDDQLTFLRTVIEKRSTDKKFTPEEGLNAYTLANKVLGLED